MALPTGYVHGTHPEEQRRLADLNELVNAAPPRRGERRDAVFRYAIRWAEGVKP